MKAKPWTKEEMYFKKVYVSALAIMKITDHAIRGKDREICGYLTGFPKNGAFYVLDAVELPIIGSDSRVQVAGEMGDKAHVYNSTLSELLDKVGRSHILVGWYHSHPGFGCFLSGIDCNTHKQLQNIYRSFFAMVVDPYRTLSKRKVELGAFMCFQNENTGKSNFFESVPLFMSEEFGIHANRYYKLEINYFQSKFESEIIKLIYKNYWIDTLSSNILLLNSPYTFQTVEDMSFKIKNYSLKKNASYIKSKDQSDMHQIKLDEISKVNTQSSVNLQNELVKVIIFNDK